MPREALMPARIDHVAICSDHYALNGRFNGGSLDGGLRGASERCNAW